MFSSFRAPSANSAARPIPRRTNRMKEKPIKKKPKLTDAERHARFKEVARVLGASEDPKDFEKAFRKLTRPTR